MFTPWGYLTSHHPIILVLFSLAYEVSEVIRIWVYLMIDKWSYKSPGSDRLWCVNVYVSVLAGAAGVGGGGSGHETR